MRETTRNNDYESRRKRVQGILKDNNDAALRLVPSADLLYLTGYRGYQTERLSCLVLTSTRAYLFVSVLDADHLPEALKTSVECVLFDDTEDPFTDLVKIIGALRTSVFISDTTFSKTLLHLQKLLTSTEFLPASSILSPLRMFKSAKEIEWLRTAQQYAGNALGRLLAWGIKGRTEQEVALQLNTFCEEEGLDYGGWGPLIAAGKNSGSPHHQPTGKIIDAGEPVLIDFGGLVEGYHADITRTVFVGRATEEFKTLYGIVLQANRAAFDSVATGVNSSEIDRAGRSVIERSGYGKFFTHRLGHGIGLELHEEPFITSRPGHILEPNMTFSDEPGIYIPGTYGIRVEDIVLCTETGAERLTDVAQELIEI
jgi:Xaa-Pro aminopeptidase